MSAVHTPGTPSARRGGPADPRARLLAAGLRRGRIELWQLLRDPQQLWGQLVANVVVLVGVVLWLPDGEIGDTGVSQSGLYVAGVVSFSVFQVGMLSLPQFLATEREDGTLLRLRGTPGGIPGYLVARVVVTAGLAVLNTVILLPLGALLADTPLPPTPMDWLTLVWVLALGLAATTLLGAAIGAVLPNPRGALALVALPVMGLMFVSGVFFPVGELPRPLQLVAEFFPLKWMAQGVRSALLPDGMLAAETSGSWQHGTTLAVLAAWTLAGALLAPRLLRRMTRRESGSRLAERRERASRRVA
ncbi:ABC transporter permease [Allostreptomyces psammosilenae]|uniref:Transport permease protein n=1 Tax=Allostreptomyces psammosilenae TaxID=1892865 RepID=A0A852ZYR0_9ACTN|nr:ABC transporter permease [Allostreptomyces psammosilenae]NYI05854.1 ABC-2 type transport system permease protein [Allostreptomyces psammosilenae]